MELVVRWILEGWKTGCSDHEFDSISKDEWARPLYLKDVLERLPTQKNHLIHELLPHLWQPKQP